VFSGEVARLSRALRIELVLPVSDAACRALLPTRELLEPTILVAPSRSAYETISDKAKVARLAENAGIAIPAGQEVGGLEEAIAVAEALTWPVMLKPVMSVARDASGVASKLGVACVSDAPELRKCWVETVGAGRALVQSVVPGWGEGIFVLRFGGKTAAAFAHRRTREKPPSGGVSVLRQSIAMQPERLSQVEEVLDAAGYEGVAMAEYKTDGTRTWLMEFNARLWGSLQLAIDAGVDFPGLLVCSAMGRPVEPVRDYRVGVQSRWLLGDLDHALLLARGEAAPDGRTGIGAALSVLLRPTGSDTRWEVLRVGDPGPFLLESSRWLRCLLR
jgi:predicted ATP-grasp superfamily ATP-dependent carboligase